MSKQDISKEAVAMMLTGSFEDTDVDTLIKMLKAADDRYHNGQESFFSDSEYDSVKQYAQQAAPDDLYFGAVGSEVRGGKVKLPFPMGSLTQVYFGDTEEWVRKYKLQNVDILITEKLDGISALLVYGVDGKLKIAYSRGDGVQGADITRHVSKIHDLPKQVSGEMVIRAEIIFKKKDWNVVKTVIKRSGGDFYKNARNCVAGLMNASTSDPFAYKYLTVGAYEVLSHNLSKLDQLNVLELNKFTIPRKHVAQGKSCNDTFLTDLLAKLKIHSEYEIDGIVLEVSDETLRAKINPTKDTLNPEYARKFKIADASNYAEAEVTKVEWNISKNAYLKPRVYVKPVELQGVTWTHATGYNAKWILDNKVGPGTIVGGQRMGDVVPNIIKIVKSTKAQMPTEDFIWTTNDKGENVDAVLANPNEVIEVAIQQTLDFFSSIDAPNLKEGSIRTMFETYKFKTAEQALVKLIKLDQVDWEKAIGANGVKIYEGLQDKLNGITLYSLAGSTTFFGRGIGVRKMKKLCLALNISTPGDFTNIMEHNGGILTISGVEGFDEKTAKKIVDGIEDFLTFYEQVQEHVTIDVESGNVSDGELSGKSFVFTGFRDAELGKQIEALGGAMQTTVSKKTTYLVAADPNASSGKLDKARANGTKVIGIQQLKEML